MTIIRSEATTKNQSNPIVAYSLAELDAALRDAAQRSMYPALPVPLALALYKSVLGLARCLRVCRRDGRLPRALSPELVTLQGAVRASASKRLTAPGLTDALAPRLLHLIEIPVRTVILALPEPVKAKEASAKKRERPLPRPVGASHWQPEGPDLNPHDVLAWHAEAVRAAAEEKRAA